MNVEDLANAGYVTEAEGEGYDRNDEMKQEAVVPAPPREPVAYRVHGQDCFGWFYRTLAEATEAMRNGSSDGQYPYTLQPVYAAEVVLRADEQDARRYRWLRANWFAMGTMANSLTAPGCHYSAVARAADVESIDAAIDAAMGDTHAG